MSAIAIEWAGRTDAGRMRENNEDAFAIARLDENGVATALAPTGNDASPSVSGMLFSVADGVGGQSAGEVASAMVVAAMAEELARFDEPPGPLTSRECGNRLETAVRRTNGRIRQAAAADVARKDMAATLSCLWTLGSRGFFAQVGDSRLYRFRARELHQLSHDQSEVGRAVRAGKISEADGKLTMGRNLLDQALGLRDETLRPEIDWLELLPGDVFLLCSDGLVDRLHDSDLAACLDDLLGRGESLEAAADALMRRADESQSRDNVTVLLVRAGGTAPAKASAAVASAPLPGAFSLATLIASVVVAAAAGFIAGWLIAS
ncbi:MAG: PP2C family protein-serine/threonine phosphatase [Opitutaceae bacterium]